MSLVNRVIRPEPEVPRAVRAEVYTPAGSGVLAAAPVLVALGAGLALAGLVDIALFYLSPQFGRAEWEFGIIAQTIDSLPLGLMGLGLTGIGALLRGWHGLARLASAVLALLALVIGALLVIYALDIPLAMRAMSSPELAVPLRRSIGKALLLGTSYVAVMGTMSVLLWRAAGRRVPVGR